LTRILKTQTRPEIAATDEQLQRRFAGLLRDGSLSGQQHLLKTIDGLDPEAIGEAMGLKGKAKKKFLGGCPGIRLSNE